MPCSACTLGDASPSASDGTSGANPSAAGDSATPEVSPARVSGNVDRGATDVPVDTTVRLRVQDGTFTKVRVSSPDGPLAGRSPRTA